MTPPSRSDGEGRGRPDRNPPPLWVGRRLWGWNCRGARPPGGAGWTAEAPSHCLSFIFSRQYYKYREIIYSPPLAGRDGGGSPPVLCFHGDVFGSAPLWGEGATAPFVPQVAGVGYYSLGLYSVSFTPPGPLSSGDRSLPDAGAPGAALCRGCAPDVGGPFAAMRESPRLYHPFAFERRPPSLPKPQHVLFPQGLALPPHPAGLACGVNADAGEVPFPTSYSGLTCGELHLSPSPYACYSALLPCYSALTTMLLSPSLALLPCYSAPTSALLSPSLALLLCCSAPTPM